MLNARIETLKSEYSDLTQFLKDNNQISFVLYINDNYKKTLLLSVASYFETTITDTIVNYAKYCSNGDDKIVALIEGKTLKRQYHTLFNWESQNANTFLSLFGEKAKDSARKRLQEKDLLDAEKAFLSLGSQRNKLVHRNYIETIIESTFEEIYSQYILACKFVQFIQEMLPNE